MVEKVNLAEKFAKFSEHWSPKVVAEVNDVEIKVVKVRGEFVWHHHEEQDEMFLVARGRLCMQFRDGEVWLAEGEFIVVPRGVEHRPVAPDEAHLVLIEPKGTLNTGNVRNERTVIEPERI